MAKRWRMTLAIALFCGMGVGVTQGLAEELFPRYRGPRQLALEDLDSLRVPAAQYVGNQVCRECHAGAYTTWLGTQHARSFVMLGTGAGRIIAGRMEVTAEHPANSSRCLACHATAADVGEAFRGAGFRVEEGVECENCHGPGGEHVKGEVSLQRRAVLATPMKIPAQEDCLRCHKERPSHDILGRKPFDFERASKRIAHPEGRREKLDLLSQRSRQVLSISLRSFLSRFY